MSSEKAVVHEMGADAVRNQAEEVNAPVAERPECGLNEHDLPINVVFGLFDLSRRVSFPNYCKNSDALWLSHLL